MLQILSLVAPVFGLIALGFLAARSGYMSEGAGRVVIELGYKIVMPAALFRAMLSIDAVPVSPLALAAAYTLAVAVIWVLTTAGAGLLLRRPTADGPAFAMATTFGNGAMLGYPIIIAAFGAEATTPLAILLMCDCAILWLIGTMHMELVRDGSRGLRVGAIVGVLWDVARNPLIIGLAGGALCRGTGFSLPPVPAKLLGLMADAGVPVALMGLGLSLAAYRIRGEGAAMTFILLIKLLVAPAVALAVALLLGLPALWIGALVAYLAMPVGANAFLFASRYDRAVAPVSGAVAASTPIAVVTVTLVLALLKAEGGIGP